MARLQTHGLLAGSAGVRTAPWVRKTQVLRVNQKPEVGATDFCSLCVSERLQAGVARLDTAALRGS